VRIYAEDWGKPGDVGVVGELEGRAIGACWMRLLPPGIGLASVDEHTPQLGIALLPEFQGKGLGQKLLTAGLPRPKSMAIGRSRSPCIPRIPRSACTLRLREAWP
jgi:GNAT superfamily N-acetyltransferase